MLLSINLICVCTYVLCLDVSDSFGLYFEPLYFYFYIILGFLLFYVMISLNVLSDLNVLNVILQVLDF